MAFIQDSGNTPGGAKGLVSLLTSIKGKVGIFTHDNPDPDAIACAAGMATLCNHLGLEWMTFFNPEPVDNQGAFLVNILKLHSKMPMESDLPDKLSELGATILVDSGVPGENNPLPKGFQPTAVIDHHSTGADAGHGEFTDIRPDLGATSTIVVEYLRELDIEMSPDLASALLFGMRIDTNDFTRRLSPEDLEAAAYLLPIADPAIMDQLTQERLDSEMMDIIGRAILNREIRGSYVLSCVDYIEKHDALYLVAEFLFKQREIQTVMVYGIINKVVHISARSRDPAIHLGEILDKAFGDKGTAGGHAESAGAQVPLELLANIDESDKYALIDTIQAEVSRDFFAALGIEEEQV